MTPTAWVERSTAATTFTERVGSEDLWGEYLTGNVGDAYVLFGVLIPQTETLQVIPPDTSWTENAESTTPWSERTI